MSYTFNYEDDGRSPDMLLSFERSGEIINTMHELYNNYQFKTLINSYTGVVDALDVYYLNDAYFLIAASNHIISNFNEAMKFYSKVISFSIENGEQGKTVFSYILIAMIFLEFDDFTKAQFYIDKARLNTKSPNSYEDLISVFELYSYSMTNPSVESIEKFKNIINSETFYNKYKRHYVILKNALAKLYIHIKDYDNALDIFMHMLKFDTDDLIFKQSSRLGELYSEVSLVFCYLEKYEDSIVYILKAIEIYEKFGNNLKLEKLYARKFGIYSMLGKKEEAIKTIRLANHKNYDISTASSNVLLTVVDKYFNTFITPSIGKIKSCIDNNNTDVKSFGNYIDKYRVLNDFSSDINATISIDEIYRISSKYNKLIFPKCNLILSFIKKGTKLLHSFNESSELLEIENFIPFQDSKIYKSVIYNREVIVVTPNKSDIYGFYEEGSMHDASNSYMYLPIMYLDEVLGVYEIIKNNDDGFKDVDIKTCQIFSIIIALKIKNMFYQTSLTNTESNNKSIAAAIDIKSERFNDIEERNITTGLYQYKSILNRIDKQFNELNKTIYLHGIMIDLKNISSFQYIYGNLVYFKYITNFNKIINNVFSNTDYLVSSYDVDRVLLTVFGDDVENFYIRMKELKNQAKLIASTLDIKDETGIEFLFFEQSIDNIDEFQELVERTNKKLTARLNADC